MDPESLTDTITAVTVIVTLAVTYGFIRFVNVWISGLSKRTEKPASPSNDSEAIARLQASIDAISIEVERISEGQRFTTRLLNERVGVETPRSEISS